MKDAEKDLALATMNIVNPQPDVPMADMEWMETHRVPMGDMEWMETRCLNRKDIDTERRKKEVNLASNIPLGLQSGSYLKDDLREF